MKQNNVITRINEQLIELFEKVGSGDVRSWIPLSGLAVNTYSKNTYYGLNQLLLSLAMYKKEYLHNNWLTFLQVKKANGSIIKGEKASHISYTDYLYLDRDGKKLGSEQIERLKALSRKAWMELGITIKKFLKIYCVFNVAQTKGLSENIVQPEFRELLPVEKHALAERIISNSQAKIVYAVGDSAHYNRMEDKIVLPPYEQFETSEDFYAVAFHELVHWTSSEDRLNRKHRSDEKSYAFEELVAELGSTYLCARLGIKSPLTSSAAYLKSWLSALKHDQMYILKASSLAEKATKYLLKMQSTND